MRHTPGGISEIVVKNVNQWAKIKAEANHMARARKTYILTGPCQDLV